MASVFLKGDKGDKGENSGKSRRKRSTNSFQHCAKKKLEKHPSYKDAGNNERELLSHQLTDTQLMLEKYFGKISDGIASSLIDRKMKEESLDLLSDGDYEAANVRAKSRVEQVAQLEVKLLLRHVDCQMPALTRAGARILKLWYGPLHSALLINGKVLVEWNTSSLVIPEDYLAGDMRHPLVTSVLHQSNRVDEPEDVRGEEIDLIFKAAAQKHEVLANLVRTIVKYNSKYTYSVTTKNCQHFVIDALKEMGCENVPKFEGAMAEYYRRLESDLERIDFDDSHANLDQYVIDNILDVSDEQRRAVSSQHKEYLLCQYFEFHVRELTNSPDPDEWVCSRKDNCRLRDLELYIDDDTRSEHQFLQPPA